MSYTKQNFNDGEILTASQLNNIENGIIKVEEDLNNTLTNELSTIETRLEDIEDSIPSVDEHLSASSDDAVANRIITKALNSKQNKLPVNTGGSSNRVWVTTCNKLKDADGNKRPSILIGTVVVPRTALGEEYLHNSDFTNITIYSGIEILWKLYELLTMESGAYRDYIECQSKDSTTKIDGTNVATTTFSYYWTYPYYFKRIIAGSDGGKSNEADGSGGNVGFVTASNFFKKWSAGEINTAYGTNGKIDTSKCLKASDTVKVTTTLGSISNEQAYKNYLLLKYQLTTLGETTFGDSRDDYLTACTNYFKASNGFVFDISNAFDNEEPYEETIASRDADGRMLVESSTYPFHAVNNKRLDEQIDTKLNEFYNNKIKQLNNINPFVSYKIYRNELGTTDITGRDQSAKKDMTGWYQIAVGPGNTMCSNMFHVNVYVNRPGYMGGVYFIVDQMNYDTTPTIKLIDYSTRKNATDVIDKIRVVYNPSQAFLSYVEIHINKNSSSTCDGWGGGSGTPVMYEIGVETLFNQVGTNFVLVDPTEIPDSFTGAVESTLVTDDLPSGYSQVVINTTT